MRHARGPRDLLAERLIATVDNALTWDEWFRHRGVVHADPIPRPVAFDPSHLATDAALSPAAVAAYDWLQGFAETTPAAPSAPH